ncbi:hypothetical protein CLU79DRAFT_775050 [Phycomyces nitens]|nr:hypothetical protein CLU79DRAFT_775050 [Phycomyces nitens]
MLIDLPFEILSAIINHLSVEDKRVCSTVCREWSLVFTSALWKHLSIRTKRQMYGLSSIQHRLPVCTLFLNAFLSINPQQLLWIQNNLSLTCVSISQEALHPDCFDTMVDWTLWQYLTKLELCTDNLWVSTKAILNTLSCLSSLLSLSWTQSDDGSSSHFGWQDIETLHINLPCLTTLYLKVTMDELSMEDIQRIINREFSPALGLTCMTWTVNTIDPHWSIYWAYKYPNLSSLYWVTVDQEINDWKIIAPFQAWPTPFQRLQHLTLDGAIYTHASHGTLFALLNRSKCLNSITYSLYTNQSSLQHIQAVFKDIMQFSDSLCSLELIVHGDVDDPNIISNLFVHCPRLVTLSICGMRIQLSLDRILDKCISLEFLYINVSRLHIRTTAPLHSIKDIILTSGNLGLCELGFLSKRCTSLKRLKLVDLVLRNDESIFSQDLFLDLSSLNLHTLCIKRVSFYKSNIAAGKSKLHKLALVLPQTSRLYDTRWSLGTFGHKQSRNTDEKEYFRLQCGSVDRLIL